MEQPKAQPSKMREKLLQAVNFHQSNHSAEFNGETMSKLGPSHPKYVNRRITNAASKNLIS